MESRRTILKGLSVSAAAMAVGPGAAAAKSGVAAGAIKAPAKAAALTARQAPWGLVAPLSAGSALGAGWTLLSLGPVQDGAAVISLVNTEGVVARLHVCRNGGAPRGLAHTPAFDLLLMNGGDGGTPSREDLGRVLLGLARVVEANEPVALAAHPELAGLMTHDERQEAFRDSRPEVLT
jgi:hypothetical protein